MFKFYIFFTEVWFNENDLLASEDFAQAFYDLNNNIGSNWECVIHLID